MPDTMAALTFSSEAGAPHLVLAYPVPQPLQGEVLIKVLRAGICSTVRSPLALCIPHYAIFAGNPHV